jgi:DNA-binding response OmpR family regulator
MEYVPCVRPTIMLVEDNPLIIEFVEAHLRRESFDVIAAESLAEATQLLQHHQPELIILDVVLDDGLGYDLCRLIRSGGEDNALVRLADVPILMLTARADEQDRLDGFACGADDYVTKPFSPKELVYRIRAILRRNVGISSALTEIGPITIDPRKRRVMVNQQHVDLTPKEFDLLHLLASKPGRVFGREELLQRVWGYSFLGNTRTVDVHVNRLRQKLNARNNGDDLITTEWGTGYKLVEPALQMLAVG